MQTQRPDNGDAQNADVRDRELETESITAFIEEFWRRFTEEPFEIRRSHSRFQIDASTHS
jgi:hypothetical protein